MRHDWSISVFLLFATLLGYSQPTGNSNGRIEGTVENEEGQLVEHAMVCTSLTTGSSTTINCQTPTDKDGRFQIRDLKFGAYHVFAVKEDGGYSIENQTPGDQVQITEDSPFSILAIRLKPKGAILVGSVRDKTTGQPLRKFYATYLNIDGGERGGGGGGGLEEKGKFRMTVPVDSDLVVAIYALGYKGWVYTDPANPSRPVLRVVSGETRRLEVEMEPTDTTSR